MVVAGDLVAALSAVTSICAVNVALFDSPGAAMSAFGERVGGLTAMMRLALSERDEAIAERDLAIEGLGSEVARLASILSNDHTNSGATTAVDRQSATGHRGPADGGEAESDAEACGEAAGANATRGRPSERTRCCASRPPWPASGLPPSGWTWETRARRA